MTSCGVCCVEYVPQGAHIGMELFVGDGRLRNGLNAFRGKFRAFNGYKFAKLSVLFPKGGAEAHPKRRSGLEE